MHPDKNKFLVRLKDRKFRAILIVAAILASTLICASASLLGMTAANLTGRKPPAADPVLIAIGGAGLLLALSYLLIEMIIKSWRRGKGRKTKAAELVVIDCHTVTYPDLLGEEGKFDKSFRICEEKVDYGDWGILQIQGESGRASAFELWLFDKKEEAQMEKRWLVVDALFEDLSATAPGRTGSNPVLPELDMTFRIETQNLVLEVVVQELEINRSGEFFTKITLGITAQRRKK